MGEKLERKLRKQKKKVAKEIPETKTPKKKSYLKNLYAAGLSKCKKSYGMIEIDQDRNKGIPLHACLCIGQTKCRRINKTCNISHLCVVYNLFNQLRVL